MDTMQLSRDIWEGLKNLADFHEKIQFGDFVTHSDRVLKSTEIDDNKGIKENAIKIARSLYDELDKILNFNTAMDFTVKNIMLPIFAEIIEEFLTLNLFKN